MSENGAGNYSGKSLPAPFDDLASTSVPKTMVEALRWTQGIAQVDPTFREAMERVSSYFITDIEVKSSSSAKGSKVSKEDKDKFEEFLNKALEIGIALRRVSTDYLVYGNSFTSVMPPIRRRLYCPHCPELIYPLKTVYEGPDFKFRWDGAKCTFNATCPKCARTSAWERVDSLAGPEADVTLKHWSAHDMEIVYDQWSDKRQYIWKIPDTYRRQIQKGLLLHLETVPWEVVEAIKAKENFRFAPKVIYHMYEPPLSGFDHQGWGIAKSLTNFRQAWTCQMLRRFNEAICQEYLIPFRVLSPEASAGADPACDPILGTNMLNFKAQMDLMVKKHKEDPGRIQVSPVAVKYQMLGGEANQLAPFQLIEQATDMLLNGSGVPADMYKGTLSLQAAPVGLRLFEARWRPLVDQLNKFLDGVVDRVSSLFGWEPVDAKLVRTRHADDLNRQMALLQLMMGGQISQSTALKALGLEFVTEQDQLVEEQEYVANKQQAMAEQQQGRQIQGQMAAASGSGPVGAAPSPQGGQPQPQGGDPSQSSPDAGGDPSQMTPEEIEDQGKQLAAQLQAAPPEQRRSTLIRLKKESPVLHGIVTQELGDQRQQAASQGQQQVLQQQFGKAASRPVPSIQQLQAMIQRCKSA